VSGVLVEGGIYFLLLFTPFAFGGVEDWALGVLQGVAGVVFVAWAWGRSHPDAARRASERVRSRADRDRLLLLWVAIALFLLLVALQLTPLPPWMIRRLSPGVDALYAGTVPGYAQGRAPVASELPAWLVEAMGDRVPLEASSQGDVAVVPSLPAPEGDDTPSSSWRTLSIYPFLTRQKLAFLLSLIGVFAAVTGHFNSRERLARLLGVAVFSGLAVSLFGILQKFSWNGKLYWIREGEYPGPFGPFVDRNTYAAFAGTILPIAVCATLKALGRIREGRRDALQGLLFNGFASVTMIGGIFYSLSRGGMISTSLSMLVIAGLLVYYGRQRSEMFLLGGILLAAAAFLIWIGPERILERVGTLSQGRSTPTLAVRIVAWRHATGLIADHLAVGTGLGTFSFAFMRYAPPGQAWWNIAHNEYVELLCDAGLAGGAIWLVGFVAWLHLVWRPAVFRGHARRYAYAGLVAGIAALLLHSAVTSNLQVPANAVVLVVLGGALMGLVARQVSRSASPDPSSRRVPPGVEAAP
jgi:O-antigen ligase/polysaccharide polymerase Wzy-like membrane protein